MEAEPDGEESVPSNPDSRERDKDDVASGNSAHDTGIQAEPWDRETEATQVLDSAITGYSDEQGQVGDGFLSPSDKLKARKSSLRVSLPFSGFPSVGYAPALPSTRTNSSVGVSDEMEEGDFEEDDKRYRTITDLQADAYIQAKPIGYRQLKLLPGIRKPKDKEVQVAGHDLQKAAALLRGIVFDQQNILWPSNGDFTIGKGERKIEEYITRCWKVCNQWFFYVKYLHCVTSCYRNKYIYEVKWSMPTKENPIPKATASVYFVIDVEIYGGREETVKVHYIIEGHRYPHIPGEVPFQQKWISSIICEKIRMQNSLNF